MKRAGLGILAVVTVCALCLPLRGEEKTNIGKFKQSTTQLGNFKLCVSNNLPKGTEVQIKVVKVGQGCVLLYEYAADRQKVRSATPDHTDTNGCFNPLAGWNIAEGSQACVQKHPGKVTEGQVLKAATISNGVAVGLLCANTDCASNVNFNPHPVTNVEATERSATVTLETGWVLKIRAMGDDF